MSLSNSRPLPAGNSGDLSLLKPSPAACAEYSRCTPDEEWNEKDETHALILGRSYASDKYLRGSLVGQGGWSSVRKVLRVKDGRVLAGKSSDTLQQLYKESNMLRKLSHNHILEFIELYKDIDNPEATLLITELCSGGTLQTRIDTANGSMKNDEVLRVTTQIADALQYLHDKQMYHSDVKPRNILIRRIDLIDAVLADCADIKVEGKFIGPLRGTQLYWSPEMVSQRQHYGKSDDVWALGISLMGMLGQWPQFGTTKQDIAEYPRRCCSHAMELQNLNPRHQLVELLVKMLAWKAEDRISAENVVHVTRDLLVEAAKSLCKHMDKDQRMDIKAPKDFCPISFW